MFLTGAEPVSGREAEVRRPPKEEAVVNALLDDSVFFAPSFDPRLLVVPVHRHKWSTANVA